MNTYDTNYYIYFEAFCYVTLLFSNTSLDYVVDTLYVTCYSCMEVILTRLFVSADPFAITFTRIACERNVAVQNGQGCLDQYEIELIIEYW